MNDITENIKIAHKLESNEIDKIEARKQVCNLLGVKFKQQFKGKAIVKSKDSIYHGYELPIVGLNLIYKNGYGVYPDGTREFILSLKDTSFIQSHGYKDTVMPETDLKILELEEF